jgi:type VI secretion system protein ImpB
MAKKESAQRKISRVRPPRVHITYDLEIGDAIEKRDLPFVVGVLGDFSGQPAEPKKPLKERALVEVDRDTFDRVLAGTKPRLAYRVDNTLNDDGTMLNVELRFNSLDDFEPDSVVQQIEPLKKLIEARKRLSDLLSHMDGNDRLEELLRDIVENPDQQQQLSKTLGLNAPGEGEARKEKDPDEQ